MIMVPYAIIANCIERYGVGVGQCVKSGTDGGQWSYGIESLVQSSFICLVRILYTGANDSRRHTGCYYV
jgi:hypothetical protein